MIILLGYTLQIWQVFCHFPKGSDMQNDNRVVLDEVSLRTLLLLSSKQPLTVEEIARAVDLDADKARDCLKYLEHKHFALLKNGIYMISQEGMNYIFEKGLQLPKLTKQSSKPTQPGSDQTLPLFGSWQDVLFWMAFIIISLILFMVLGLFLTSNFSLAWRITVYTILGLLWLFLFFLIIKGSYRSVPEYERLVIFRLGKCWGAKGPGPILNLPIDSTKTVDLRVKHQEVPHEACITQDNVQIDVDFVFYWKIQNPVWSVTKVTDPEESIKLLATALLRAVIAHFPFNEVLNKRESINDMLRTKIDDISSEWGVFVTTMEIREIKPPEEIVFAMHKQREAEWNRQATMINADAQAQALKMLYEIANSIDDKTLSLKYFDMLKELGQGESTKYIFPLELMDLVKPLIQSINKRDKGESTIVLTNPNEKPQGS
jgi:regulator of protease activity HflC (stomatin/prohibitin superfamily)